MRGGGDVDVGDETGSVLSSSGANSSNLTNQKRYDSTTASRDSSKEGKVYIIASFSAVALDQTSSSNGHCYYLRF